MPNVAHVILPVGLASTIALAYASTLAPDITWANQGTDGGDLITAAATLGIAHPTGYPTYLMLVRGFQYLPVGSLAFRANVFSAWAAVMTVVGVYAVILRLLYHEHKNPRWVAPSAATIAALLFAFSPLFWSQAVIAEVATLHTLFVVVLLAWTYQACCPHKNPLVGYRGQALIAGLALGNHSTILLSVVVWFITIGLATPPSTRGQVLRRCGVWISIGLLVYAYLPLRAATYPPVNWGNPQTWTGFWWVITANLYHEYAFGLPVAFWGARVSTWAALLLDQIGVLGLVLGIVGLLYGQEIVVSPSQHSEGDGEGNRNRFHWTRFLGATLGLVGGYSLFALMYNTTDSTILLLPVYLVVVVWVGIGIARVIRWGIQGQGKRQGMITAVLGMGMVGLLFWHVPTTVVQVDASKDNRAVAFIHAVLTAAPPYARIVTSGDRDTFALWYAHYAQGQRSDIALVAQPLLRHAWYREHIQTMYPNRDWQSWERGTGDTDVQETTHMLCYTQPDLPPFLTCYPLYARNEDELFP